MYQDFFGFREPPFRITPDPRVLYRNRCYEEAIAALAYGIEQRKGFMSLVGEVGTGKTTLLRHLLETVSPNVRTVLLLYPTISFEEILEQVLLELGVPVGGSGKGVMLQRLHEFLLEHTHGGGNVALLFDEAQALEARTLEELRLVSNFETGTEKIVQIVLAGQPELEERLRLPEHRQLRQRIALHVRLRPLDAAEVADYVRVRLEHVDAPDPGVFTPEAVARIAELTGGIPRVVNVLCDACCTTAFALGRPRIDRAIVNETWADYAGLASETAPTAAAPEPFLPPPPPLGESPAAAATPPSAGDAVARLRSAPPPQAVPRPAVSPVARWSSAATAPWLEGDPDPEAAVEGDDDEEQPLAGEALTGWNRPDDPQGQPFEERWPIAMASVLGVLLAVFIGRELLLHFEVPGSGDAVTEQVASTPTAAPPALTGPPGPTGAGGLGNTPSALASLPPPAPAPAAVETAPPAAVAPAAPAPGGASEAPSAIDALDLVDEFRRAYEQRQVERLGELFADDATKGELTGRDAILDDYRRFFAGARDLLYSQPSASVEPHGDHVVVRAPFEITYRDAADRPVEVRGTAIWQIVEQEGTALIRSLDFELSPVGPSSG